MRREHVYDPGFTNSSSELKRILADGWGLSGGQCIDIPCGNGRNIFLLASYFQYVMGVDLNEAHLKTLEDSRLIYADVEGAISTKKMDISAQIPEQTRQADLITTIHYYNFSFASSIIAAMRPGAFFYMESPSCAGENYRDLPNEKEIAALLTGMEVLLLKIRPCQCPGQSIKNVSFKALLKKSND